MLRAIAVLFTLGSAATAAAQPPDSAVTYAVPLDPTIDGSTGAADAPVTIVTGTEYACPYCEKVHREQFAEIAKTYGRDVRFVYRQFVVHPQIATVSSAASCAAQRQGAWAAMDARLWDAFRAREFDNASCLDDPKTCTHTNEAVAALRLDANQFWRDMPDCRRAIAAAQAAWSSDLHIGAIPAVFINGRFLSGAQPVENFTKIIDEELAKAKRAVAKGARRARYYEDAVVAHGTKTAPADPPPVPPVPPAGGGAPAGIMARPPARPMPSATATYAVTIDPSIDGIAGRADAKLTLVIASDYACPYCEKMEPVLADLATHYGRDLRIVHRQFVVHPTNATAYALAACAANRQGAFARLDALLWDDYRARKWDTGECWTDPAGCPLIDAHARALKLDRKRLVADMAACKQPIEDARVAWQQKLGVNAIPTVFINGRFLQGAQPIDNFITVADEELAKATERINHGARAADYYHDWVEVRGAPDLATP